jgi:hypothetical protein
VEGIAYDSHHRRGFRHEPSVALHHFAKISGAFLVVRAALLGRRFCPARAAVRAVRRSRLCSKCLFFAQLSGCVANYPMISMGLLLRFARISIGFCFSLFRLSAAAAWRESLKKAEEIGRDRVCLTGSGATPTPLLGERGAGVRVACASSIGSRNPETGTQVLVWALRACTPDAGSQGDADFVHAMTSGLFAGVRARQVADRSVGYAAGFLPVPQ